MFHGTIPKNNFNIKYPKGDNLYRNAESLYLTRSEDKEAIDYLFDIRPLSYYFRPFRIDHDWNEVIMVRFGGLGDILAMTPIMQDLTDKGFTVNFHTMDKNFPLFNWIKPPVNPKSVTEPLVEDFTLKNRIAINDSVTKLTFEDTIEQGIKENWYEHFYKLAGMDFNPEKGRPVMKVNEDVNSELDENAVILVNRATSPSRSMSLEDMHTPLKDFVDNKNIYVYAMNMNSFDANYAKKEKINIIFRSTVQSFLDDMATAKLVISTDTASVHFREGLELPAIALYSAFNKDSRTQYYKYTKSYDLDNGCPHSPCMLDKRLHQKFCHLEEMTDNKSNAPCLRTDFNDTLHTQLYNIYKNNL